jgi:hypothetical protein
MGSLKRKLHRKAVRQLLNGNHRPAEQLAEELDKKETFNCGKNLNRKFRKKVLGR